MRIRVALPAHLRALAGTGGEVSLEVREPAPATAAAVLDALERDYPMLKGTVRDPLTGRRRPFLRFFACGSDLSQEPLEKPLPAEVQEGKDAFLILGAIAGG